MPRPNDVFGERLYCVRWVETYRNADGEERTRRHYRSVSAEDVTREQRVFALLQERLAAWQAFGYTPNRPIEPGDKTDEPTRTRGWTYWHHLFTPRHLLLLGQFGLESSTLPDTRIAAACLLALGRCANWSSRITQWLSGKGDEKTAASFANQALNTLSTYALRPLDALADSWFLQLKSCDTLEGSSASAGDARSVGQRCELWLTDPPYADAVSYHELSEFFLAWYDKPLQRLFPDWYTDSKRAFAVSGADESFRASMVECYRNLAAHMPDDGMQVVMFTHRTPPSGPTSR